MSKRVSLVPDNRIADPLVKNAEEIVIASACEGSDAEICPLLDNISLVRE